MTEEADRIGPGDHFKNVAFALSELGTNGQL